MAKYSYKTPSKVSLYVDGYWVDDAAAVAYDYNEERWPIKGFASRKVRTFGRGDIIVTGFLDILYRAEGYLNNLFTPPQEDAAPSQTLAEYLGAVSLQTFLTTEAGRVELLQTLASIRRNQPTQYGAVTSLVEDVVGVRQQAPAPLDRLDSPEFSINIQYTKTPDIRQSKSIVGVVFTGESQVIENTIQSGAEYIIERYKFLAKDVVSGV